MANFKARFAGLAKRIDDWICAVGADWQQRDMVEARKRINASLRRAEEEKQRRNRANGRYR